MADETTKVTEKELNKALSELFSVIALKFKDGSLVISESAKQVLLDLFVPLIDYNEYVSVYECCKFLGISRTTFDNYVKKGLIPKGLKRAGWKELGWRKKDVCHLRGCFKQNAIQN